MARPKPFVQQLRLRALAYPGRAEQHQPPCGFRFVRLRGALRTRALQPMRAIRLCIHGKPLLRQRSSFQEGSELSRPLTRSTLPQPRQGKGTQFNAHHSLCQCALLLRRGAACCAPCPHDRRVLARFSAPVRQHSLRSGAARPARSARDVMSRKNSSSRAESSQRAIPLRLSSWHGYSCLCSSFFVFAMVGSSDRILPAQKLSFRTESAQ